MIEHLWLILLGFAAGVLGSLLGLGGGVVVVPVLTFLGFSPTLAASNSLFAALSNAIASTLSYARQKRIDFSLGLKLGLLSVPGTLLGALISTDVAHDIFKVLFGLILIASAAYIFLRKKLEGQEKTLSKQMVVFVVGASFFCWNNICLFWYWGWHNLCSIDGSRNGNDNEKGCSYSSIDLVVLIIFWCNCT